MEILQLVTLFLLILLQPYTASVMARAAINDRTYRMNTVDFLVAACWLNLLYNGLPSLALLNQ